jgi:adenine-specific DNA-methyltransferase
MQGDAIGLGKKIHLLVQKNYAKRFDVLLAHNDVLRFLETVPNASFQLVVSSPPYNIRKPYEDDLKFSEYLAWQEEVLKECVRVLKSGGSLCWQVGNYVEKGEVFPLDVYFYDIIKSFPGLRLRNRIIWFYEHGLHSRRRLSNRYETILWFTKGEPYMFSLDEIRVRQKYPGKTHFKGPNYGKPSSNPLGKNPGDVWRVVSRDWQSMIWDIPNVKGNHIEKTIHPAQFPIGLVERLVLALSKPRDTVLDPFMGSGSTVVAAILHNRRAAGVDRERAYVDLAMKRVKQTISGKLRYRPLGARKHVPTGREKVTRIPEQWLQRGYGERLSR